MKKCTKCLEILSKDNFNKNKTNKDGLHYKCKKCTKEYNNSHWKKYNTSKNKEYKAKYSRQYRKSDDEHKKQKIRYFDYTGGAKERGYDFSITYEQFISFWKKPCYYCGDEIETIGLDRTINKIGYTIENIVPCCYSCNKMKMVMDKDDFIERILKIAKNIDAATWM